MLKEKVRRSAYTNDEEIKGKYPRDRIQVDIVMYQKGY